MQSPGLRGRNITVDKALSITSDARHQRTHDCWVEANNEYSDETLCLPASWCLRVSFGPVIIILLIVHYASNIDWDMAMSEYTVWFSLLKLIIKKRKKWGQFQLEQATRRGRGSVSAPYSSNCKAALTYASCFSMHSRQHCTFLTRLFVLADSGFWKWDLSLSGFTVCRCHR